MSTENLQSYQCAFNDEKHFLIEPIQMNCGHFICKMCSKTKSNCIITCFTCEKKNRIDFKNLNEKNEMKYIIESNLGILFSALEKQFLKKVTDLNSTYVSVCNTWYRIISLSSSRLCKKYYGPN
jgi:hypothetical protein